MLHLDFPNVYNTAVVQESIRILQAQGYKATRPRKLVLEVLEEIERPLSPYDIQEILRARGKHLNHVTIYRILDLLCQAQSSPQSAIQRWICQVQLGCYERAAIGSWSATTAESFREFADKELCQEENEFALSLGFHTGTSSFRILWTLFAVLRET
jgi:hypothetical protein